MIDYLPGIRVVRFKTRLSDSGGLVLRRFRLRDGRHLHGLFAAAPFHEAVGADAPASGSLLHFWRWLHRTFQWFYTINGPRGDAESIIGFIGLYGMQGKGTLKLAIAFFSPRDRRRGYGRRALELLLDDFRRRAVVQDVRVDVNRRNEASLAFFRRLGFQPIESADRIQELIFPLADRDINGAPVRRRPPCPSARSTGRCGDG
jgi:RimJ/RimL family protein N-acetyltransferase